MGLPKNTRVVVTIPPSNWFGGFDRIGTMSQVEQLERRFGLEFYQLDATPWMFDDKFSQQKQIEDLREYGPDIAIALVNSGYGLLCSTKIDGDAKNLFTDILGIPLVMPWDHGIFQFPAIIPTHYPHAASEGRNIKARIRAVIDNPLMHHLPIDSQQVSEMRRIGMMTTDNVTVAPAATYLPYLEFGQHNPAISKTDQLTFVGNIYAGTSDESAAGSGPERRVRDFVVNAKHADPLTNSWATLMEALSVIPEADRTAHRLDFDDKHFWDLADELVTRNCNKIARSKTLQSIAREISLYGEFAPGSSVKGLEKFRNIRYKGFVDFTRELPAVYARSDILVDIGNAAFMANCSSKPICCLAAGGFPLFDYKKDVAGYLGQDADLLMYKSTDELNGKIDYYLTHAGERQQLAASLQDQVRRKCDFANIVYECAERALANGSDNRTASLKKPAKVIGLPDEPGPDAVELVAFDLRQDLVVHPDWTGAQIVNRDPVEMQTADAAWGYSGYLGLQRHAPLLEREGRHWLAIDCRCLKGACALSLLYGGDLVSERALRPSNESSVVYFRIQFKEGLSGLIVRSYGEGSSRLQIGSIKLLHEVENPGPNATELVVFDLPKDLIIQTDWVGAQVVSSDPVVIQTAEAPWGYSGYLDLHEHASVLEADGRDWLAIDCRCTQGQCGISLMYGEDLVSERALGPSSDGSVVHFRIEVKDGLSGVMIRSYGESSSQLEIGSIKLFREVASS